VLYSDIVLLAAIVLKPETICRYYPKSKIADVSDLGISKRQIPLLILIIQDPDRGEFPPSSPSR
jgi:hypothetical protein